MTPPPGPYCMTASGLFLSLDNPEPDQILIEDIATGLAKACRYAGQISEFYSVAQHSMIVSYWVGQKDALWGLLHDAAEAYLLDLPTPIKRLMPDYQALEARVMAAICEKFGLPPEMPASVKEADENALVTEAHQFCHPNHRFWSAGRGKLLPLRIEPYPWETARLAFLRRFHKLQELAA